MPKQRSNRCKVVLGLSIFVALSAAPLPMLAQRTGSPTIDAPFAPTIEELSRRHFDMLFRGILLDSARRARADSIVRKAVTAQLHLDRSTADVWSKLRAIIDRRNTAVRQLLTSDADRATLDSNIARFFPRPGPR